MPKRNFYELIKCKSCDLTGTVDKIRSHERKHAPKKKCDHPDCKFQTSYDFGLTAHKKRVHGEKPLYKCPFPDCKFEHIHVGRLNIHKKVHEPRKCKDCDFVGDSSEMIVHREKHRNETKKKCSHENCKFEGGRKEMKRHLETHNMKICGVNNCTYQTPYISILESHKASIHSENELPRPYECDECKSTFTSFRSLTVHKKIHTDEKKYKCSHPGCYYKAFVRSKIILHNMIHTGQKNYSCEFPGCEHRSRTQAHMNIHKKTHTIEGQIRRKNQENIVYNLLKKWGNTVEIETIIKAKSSNCLLDTNRYFSRIDFHIVNCVNMLLFIECDEYQHTWYNLSCELSRMVDVRASLVKNGYVLPIYWIRYSPNGKYHINGDQVEIVKSERELILKNHIEYLCSSDFVPDKQVNIHYMFYDLISEEDGPEITIDPDFPDVLKECVTWNLTE